MRHYQLLVKVSTEVPDVYCPTLIPNYQCGLVRVETHAVDGCCHLEQPLTLLGVTPITRCNLVVMTTVTMAT